MQGSSFLLAEMLPELVQTSGGLQMEENEIKQPGWFGHVGPAKSRRREEADVPLVVSAVSSDGEASKPKAGGASTPINEINGC